VLFLVLFLVLFPVLSTMLFVVLSEDPLPLAVLLTRQAWLRGVY
jgi:hypothetical protein